MKSEEAYLAVSLEERLLAAAHSCTTRLASRGAAEFLVRLHMTHKRGCWSSREHPIFATRMNTTSSAVKHRNWQKHSVYNTVHSNLVLFKCLKQRLLGARALVGQPALLALAAPALLIHAACCVFACYLPCVWPLCLLHLRALPVMYVRAGCSIHARYLQESGHAACPLSAGSLQCTPLFGFTLINKLNS